MYLLDIASAPLYTVFGGSFLLIAAVVFAVVWVAARLILGIIGKNSVSESEKRMMNSGTSYRSDGFCAFAAG